MSESITLTAAATAAAQFLNVLDSGESLSAQQLTDALNAANNLLESWTNEQTQAMAVLIKQQTEDAAAFVAKQTGEGLPFVAIQAAMGAPLATAYTLAAGVYTIPTYTAPSIVAPTFVAGTLLQFPDATTPINVPNGYSRALKLGLAIELAPQYNVAPTPALLKDYVEARAAANPMPGQTPIPGAPGASPAQAQQGATQ